MQCEQPRVHDRSQGAIEAIGSSESFAQASIDHVQVFVEGRREALRTYGEAIQPAMRDRAPSECPDDLTAPLWRDHWSSISNWTLASSLLSTTVPSARTARTSMPSRLSN